MNLLASLRRVLPVCAALTLLTAVACGPRGESNSLDQVFSDARSSYTSKGTNGLPTDVSGSLDKLVSDLNRLAGLNAGGDAKEISRGIADSLDALVSRSGLTQRPSMTELVNQYRAVGNESSAAVSIGAPNLKLLAARTYNLLSSELTSTRFGL